MYLKYLNDDNVKTAFISQIILISKLSNLNIGNFLENNDNSYSFFNLFYDRDKYKKIVLSLIDEMSNNSKDLKYTLNESAENSKKFLEHLESEDSNSIKNIDSLILDRFFSKYSNAISSSDIKSKKICYFEIINYFATISKDIKEDVINKIKDVYFVYLRNKLNIDDKLAKEIVNFIYSTESIYKSLNDLINIG
ncbi:hypothetical protein [Brachyspira innocens]|uniref:hypothetical protein n=1 Tax=Brachyspira innocens TaxID=13264 RepID=UPI0026E97412|nr:hypothetical protein [Brachyspira innocens]